MTDFLEKGDDEIDSMAGETLTQDEYHAEELTGEALLRPELCIYCWRSMYRRAFLTEHNLHFVPHLYGSEDVPFADECFLKAGKCLHAHWNMFIYRQRPGSITSRYNMRRAHDMCTTLYMLWERTKLTTLTPTMRQRQLDIVYSFFREYIYAISYGHLKATTEMVAAIDTLRQRMPDLRLGGGLKRRIIIYMYARSPHLFVYACYAANWLRKRLG